MPTVIVTTPAFLPLVTIETSLEGLVDPRTIVVDHPIGGVDEAGVLQRADQGAKVLRQLLGIA